MIPEESKPEEPDSIDTSPDFPLVEFPEETEIFPLSPNFPPLDDARTNDPLDFSMLFPVVNETEPPSDAILSPALITMLPLIPLRPLPLRRAIDPPPPDTASPVNNVIVPDSPKDAEPVLNDRPPEVPLKPALAELSKIDPDDAA